MVGGQGDIAVVKISDSSSNLTLAVNLRTHRTVWQREFAATSVVGTTVAVLEREVGESHLKTFDLSTGEPMWAVQERQVVREVPRCPHR